MKDNLEQRLIETSKRIVVNAITKGVSEAFMTTSVLIDIKYILLPDTFYVAATADMIRKSPDALLREHYLLPYYYRGLE